MNKHQFVSLILPQVYLELYSVKDPKPYTLGQFNSQTHFHVLGISVVLILPSLFYTNIVFSAEKYSGEVKQCCVDGMRDNKLGYTCERRARYIADGKECVDAFLHCCNQMKTHKDMKDEDEEMALARSKYMD